MRGQDLTEGSIAKQLWSLAWPMMLSMFFFSLYNLVDAFWVSKLSTDAIAAVSISQITLFAMISLAMGISVGSAVLMGSNIGSKNKEEAERVLGQGYVLALLSAILFTTFALIFRDHLLSLSGAVGGIMPLAIPYFTITAVGSVLMFLMMTTTTAFNAQGDNFTPTKLFAVSTFVNIILDPILIFGWNSIPAFGISGAAYATLISQAVFLALAFYVLMGKKMMVQLKLSNLTLKLESVKKVFNIGIPTSLTQVLNPIGFSILMAIVASAFAEAGAAAFSIGFRIEFFAFIPAIGFGFGAMAMMGQNSGAGKRDRVKQIMKTAVSFGVGAALLFSVLAFIFAPQIIGVFTTDPVVTAYALQYFRIVPLGYIFFAVAFIEASIFQGISRSWPGFWITFGRVGLTALVAYILVYLFSFPIWSVWSALVLGSVISSVLGYFWMSRAINTASMNVIPPEEVLEAEEQLPMPVG